MLEAETIMQDVIQRRRRVFGRSHPDTLRYEQNLAPLRAKITHLVSELTGAPSA